MSSREGSDGSPRRGMLTWQAYETEIDRGGETGTRCTEFECDLRCANVTISDMIVVDCDRMMARRVG